MGEIHTKRFNNLRDLRTFVNEEKITKEQVVAVFPDEGLYCIVYYAN